MEFFLFLYMCRHKLATNERSELLLLRKTFGPIAYVPQQRKQYRQTAAEVKGHHKKNVSPKTTRSQRLKDIALISICR